MHRRHFLGLGAALPLSSFLGPLGCGAAGDEAPSTLGPGGDDAGAGPDVAPGTDAGTPGTDAATAGDAASSLETLPVLPLLPNESATPGTFHATLRARKAKLPFAGGTTEFWAYEGLLPGPMIVVHEGDRVQITLKNELDQATTVHWHGLAIPPSQDGMPMDTAAPGGTHDYDFVVPEGSAGTYWYHPHPHMTTAEQVAHGLAGALVVLPKGAGVLPAYAEKVLFLEDLKLAADGSIAASSMMDRMNGREGNHVVVNGVERPTIAIRPGERQRWRLVNATSARFFRFVVEGHALVQVGTDGGLLGAPVDVDEVFLAPGMRAEIVVTGGDAGGRAAIKSLAYDHGHMMMGGGGAADLTLGTLVTTSEPPVTSPPVPSALWPIAPLPAGPRVTRVTLGESGMMMGSGSFTINGKTYDPARVDWTEKVGVSAEWDVVNGGGMDHPFHVHGGSFQVVSRTRAGKTTAEPFLAWRDVVNLQAGDTVRLRMRFPSPGKRLVHCHILEHEDAGMMATFDVSA